MAGKYQVRPTGEVKGDQYSDTALTGLFNAYIAIINSERQTIWQRYNIMLVANTVVLSFLGAGFRVEPTILEQFNAKSGGIYGKCLLGGGVFFGLFLCLAWLVMTYRGWNAFEDYCLAAKKFVWHINENGVTRKIKNPMEIHFQHRGANRKRGLIYSVSLLTVLVFMVAYIVTGVIYLLVFYK